VRSSLRVTGVVQGVGYRPFVHRLAEELSISGTVRNDTAGVLIDAWAPEAVLAEFARRLQADAPGLASVRAVTVLGPVAHDGAPPDGFRIIASDDVGGAITALPPDVAVCDACLAEMRDPSDRRHRYPFVTCTECGPRFTITRHMPYDRPNTTMAGFPLCAQCQAEYDDPHDRRHHAQPLACPVCGPQLALTDAAGAVLAERDGAVRAAQALLDGGSIVAVKGIGGYHLMCAATDAAAVARLRERKRRGAKPFAVLVADVADIADATTVSAAEHAALASPQRPIVLLRRALVGGATWPDSVAPGAADVGVMLPCAPVQHLLLDGLATRVVVCTSGNLADEPIATDDADARARLGAIADAFLTHDRPIHAACDDSVVRVHAGTVTPVRRARGYVPLPLNLSSGGTTVLAMGGDLKGALCLAVGDQAFLSQHLGDHGQLATYAAARQAAHQLCDLVGTTPDVVAVDAHPGYLSARLGRELAAEWGVAVVEAQHHHAHVIAAAAEHGVGGPVLGFAFDGTGYGTDATIWGGEVLAATATGFRRVAHLRPVALPGGDAAIEHPARAALAHLWAAGVEWHDALPCVAAVAPRDREVLRTMLATGSGTVLTSSCGRLFDAVAALCGVRQRVDYEAQAAIELEAVADPAVADAYAFPPADAEGAIDPAPVIRAVVADVLAGIPPATISTRFHRALVSLVDVQARTSARDTEGPGRGAPVVLSGGVFQNLLLADLCTAVLMREGFTVLRHRQVPTNDGGLALGQAVIARALTERTG
jgi:hydrogenase maturation protein HypF